MFNSQIKKVTHNEGKEKRLRAEPLVSFKPLPDPEGGGLFKDQLPRGVLSSLRLECKLKSLQPGDSDPGLAEYLQVFLNCFPTPTPQSEGETEKVNPISALRWSGAKREDTVHLPEMFSLYSQIWEEIVRSQCLTACG